MVHSGNSNEHRTPPHQSHHMRACARERTHTYCCSPCAQTNAPPYSAFPSSFSPSLPNPAGCRGGGGNGAIVTHTVLKAVLRFPNKTLGNAARENAGRIMGRGYGILISTWAPVHTPPSSRAVRSTRLVAMASACTPPPERLQLED